MNWPLLLVLLGVALQFASPLARTIEWRHPQTHERPRNGDELPPRLE